jgi:hypothetical protein
MSSKERGRDEVKGIQVVQRNMTVHPSASLQGFQIDSNPWTALYTVSRDCANAEGKTERKTQRRKFGAGGNLCG